MGRELTAKQFLLELKDGWTRDKVSDAAGSVTYFALLSLFPFLLFALSLASVVIEPGQVEGLLQQLAAVAPPQVAGILRERVLSLVNSGQTGILTFGAVGAIWAASSGAGALITALNTVNHVEESRPFWKVRLVALGMVLVGAVLAIVAALLAVVTPVLASRLPEPLHSTLLWLRLPLAGAVMVTLLAVIYTYAPDAKARFRLLTPGAIIGVLLWLLGSWGFSLYVSNFGKYEATYGTLGGVVVLLVWMWISSQVLLLGAEINAVLGAKPSEVKAPEPAAPAPPVQRRPRSTLTRAAIASALGAAYVWTRRGRHAGS